MSTKNKVVNFSLELWLKLKQETVDFVKFTSFTVRKVSYELDTSHFMTMMEVIFTTLQLLYFILPLY